MENYRKVKEIVSIHRYFNNRYQVNGFYTSPTALRTLRKEDPDGAWIKKYNTKSLHNVSMAGERLDIPTYEWIHSSLGVLINDNYW